MPVFIPATLPDHEPDWVVVLYCAAWCDTCTQYREKFEMLARSDAKTEAGRRYACIDIEDEPEWLGDEDVENFPTLGVQYRGRTLFFGTMLPHIGHLERMLQALSPDSPDAAVQLPAVSMGRLSEQRIKN